MVRRSFRPRRRTEYGRRSRHASAESLRHWPGGGRSGWSDDLMVGGMGAAGAQGVVVLCALGGDAHEVSISFDWEVPEDGNIEEIVRRTDGVVLPSIMRLADAEGVKIAVVDIVEAESLDPTIVLDTETEATILVELSTFGVLAAPGITEFE